MKLERIGITRLKQDEINSKKKVYCFLSALRDIIWISVSCIRSWMSLLLFKTCLFMTFVISQVVLHISCMCCAFCSTNLVVWWFVQWSWIFSYQQLCFRESLLLGLVFISSRHVFLILYLIREHDQLIREHDLVILWLLVKMNVELMLSFIEVLLGLELLGFLLENLGLTWV